MLSAQTDPPRPALRWRTDLAAPVVEASGVMASTGAVLAVFAEPADAPPAGGRTGITASLPMLPPMAGATTWHEGVLRFTPEFPLVRGVRYRAELRVPGLTPIVATFALPADTTPATTVVTQIFPSGDVLPENQLKFYCEFSAPMSRGLAYPHVHLRDAAGREIDLAFLELDEELWDPTTTRLTLLIDPGRIKRGVKPLEDVGPVFEAGRSYSLSVDAAMRDAHGRPLRSAFEKRFRVGPADRVPPDAQRWKVRAPTHGTREPLIVSFDEPMDRALAQRLIRVVAGPGDTANSGEASGPAIDGEVSLGSEEREWRFVPAQPWRRGPHHLAVTATIEDLAGNNIGKLFDVDVFTDVSRRIEHPSVRLAFEAK
jgi:hypothetical protein